MRIFQRLFVIIMLPFSLTANAQKDINVLHYKFEMELSDQSDTIHGRAEIQLVFLNPVSKVLFDFKTDRTADKSLTADKIEGPNMRGFMRYDDSLMIPLLKPAKVNDTAIYIITYSGVPSDGLIISKNKFNQRTFFADNWPNRAHNWIPCVDDLQDKASVEFIVTAPAHYQVVANGIQIEETNLPGNKKLTHWREDTPLPTKVMVIGAADFAVNYTGDVNCIPVSTWVFPGNRKDGFYEYAPAKDILSFFIDYIGPYPYKKLANIQSLTIFGGMENASAIFYSESSVTGKQNHAELLAHEIVHQWFGNMATEKSFPHLWLSEGFATYLAIMYIGKRYGADSARSMRKEDRLRVTEFCKTSALPVVDSISPYMNLLNANSYQKGGWVLHMLHCQLGDAIFQKAVQTYYSTYAGKNADTRDLEQVFEKVSGKNLTVFFKQWLYTPGIPDLDIKWSYAVKEKKVIVTVKQLQKLSYQFPLELLIQNTSGKNQAETIQINQSSQSFSFAVKEKPSQLKADPSVNLLFEGTVSQTK